MNFKARFFFFFFFHFFFFFAPPSLPSKNRNSGPVAEKEVDVHLFSQLCDSSFVLFLFFFPILSDVVDNVPLSVSTGGHWPPPSPWSFTAETIAIDAHQHCDRRNLERKKKATQIDDEAAGGSSIDTGRSKPINRFLGGEKSSIASSSRGFWLVVFFLKKRFQ